MSPSNTRAQDGGRPSRSNSANKPLPSRSSPSRCCCLPFGMASVFNIIRGSVYVAVLVWTVICLGIAAHFQSILVSSDLTRFVPFAIFVCSASLLLIVALLGFGFWKDRNPISTRVELGCLGLLGVLWLALGAFLASSESGDSDVECFSSADTTEPTTFAGFNTETFHAQYRVLEAFSFFNVILIWLFLLMLLGLALRHHRWGTPYVWTSSVTAFPWFGDRDAQKGKSSGSRSRSAPLPPPATAKRTQSSRSQRPNGGLQEKRPSQSSRNHHRRPSATRHDTPTKNETQTYVYWIPHTAPEPAQVGATAARQIRDKYHRNASPRR